MRMVDPQTFERTVRRYQRMLVGYLWRRLGYDEGLTLETFDDVICVLYRRWDDLDAGEDIAPWLFRVADNCIMANVRKNERYYSRHVPLDEARGALRREDLTVTDVYFNDPGLTDEELVERVRDSLPERMRDLFTYRFIEKKTIEEISEITGIPYSTLRYRLIKCEAAARRNIKEMFEG